MNEQEIINLVQGNSANPELEMAQHGNIPVIQPRPTPNIKQELEMLEKTHVIVDIKKWNLGDFEDWLENTEKGGIRNSRQILMKVVTAWNYKDNDGNTIPCTIEGSRLLSLPDFKEVMQVVAQAANKSFLS